MLNESEASLIERLRNNDEAAFKQLVEQFQDKVYNIVLSILQNPSDAEDTSQEVFIKVYQLVGNFKAQSSLYTWIYRIAVNQAFEFIRYKKRKKRFAFLQSLFGDDSRPDIQVPDFVHPGTLMEQQEDAKALWQAIDKLPEQQKAALVLYEMEHLSYQEISQILDKTVSSVESLLHRARQNLKKYLENYYRKSL